MDIQKVKRMIGQCDNDKELTAIIAAAKERKELLWKRRLAQNEADAWLRVKDLQRDAVLYCCAEGTFMGGPIQRGDKMTVYDIQPRAKRLWVTLPDGKRYWFSAGGVNRYNLRLEPPANPLSATERATVNAISHRVASTFSEPR